MTSTLDRPPVAAQPVAPPAAAAAPARPRAAWWAHPSVVAGLSVLLTCSAFSPVFDSAGWWLPVGLAVVAAVGLNVLARRLRVPAALHGLVSLAGLALFLSARYASAAAVLGVLPGTGTLSALSAVRTEGAADVNRLAVPVPPTAGIVLFVVVGVWVVAHVVDQLFTGARRPLLAGLLLLALFVVPAAIIERGGVGVVPFALAAVGFVLLLAADARYRQQWWGPVLGAARAGGSGGGLAGARLLAVGAVLVALVVPLGLPDLDRDGLFNRYGAGDGLGGGRSSTTIAPPIVSLENLLRERTERPLLRVTTDQPTYLRSTALDAFDGTRFTLDTLQAKSSDQVSRGLPALVPAAASTVPVQTTVQALRGYRQRYLSVPYAPTAISVDGDWRLSQPTDTVFSSRADTSNRTWSVTAAVPQPNVGALRSDVLPPALPLDLRRDLEVPAGPPRPLFDAALAEAITGRTSNYDRVRAIQDYLSDTTRFTYTLTPADTGISDPLESFITGRQGYCQQFSATMVVMARQLGIPARVAVGFVPGTLQPDGSYLVTNKDAHAWPEVWFPSSGWVRFEPTPRSDGRSQPPTYADATSPLPLIDQNPTPDTPQQDPGAVDTPPVEAPAAAPVEPSTAAAGSSATDGGLSVGWVLLVVLVVAVAVVAIPGLVRRRTRGHRLREVANLGVAAVAWAEILATAQDLRIALPGHHTPRAVGRVLEQRSPSEAMEEAVARLVRAEERERYAPPAGHGAGGGARAADVRLVVDELTACSPRGTRLRARLWPSSTVQAGSRSVAGHWEGIRLRTAASRAALRQRVYR